MKRREFLKLMAGAVGYFALSDILQNNTLEAANNKGYHIVLISDLHLPWRIKNFPKTSEGKKIFAQKEQMIKTINAFQDAKEVALLGDFAARYGKEEEFLSVDKFLNELKLPKYFVVGNHDYAYRDSPNKQGKLKRGALKEQTKKLNAFKERYKMPALYYARTIGKYRLLYLAPDEVGKLNIQLSNAQLEWMKNEILSHRNGPVIFFCHAPLMNTLETYHKSINKPQSAAQPDDKIAEILKFAPKGSLWVSGHTHTPPSNKSYADDEINRYNDTVVNIHNPTIDAKELYTNSLFLYDDRVIVKTFDYQKNAWIDKFTREYKN